MSGYKIDATLIPDSVNTGINSGVGLGVLGLNPKTKLSTSAAKLPPHFFSVDNYYYAFRNVINSVYLENLLPSVEEITFAGGLNSYILRRRNNTTLDTATRTMTVSGAAYSSKTLTATLYSTRNSILSGKKVMLQQIGDSITAMTINNEFDVAETSFSVGSQVLLNLLRDRVDSSNDALLPRLIGHQNTKSKSETYRSTSITVRSGNSAMGGWTAASFLRHAMLLTGEASPSIGLSAQLSYYILGLHTATGVDYSGTTTQLELIRTTVQGKNDCDKNATLFNWMKTQSGWAGGSGSYSSGENAAMDTWVNSRLDNPVNPFYSKEKAQTSGTTNAFDYDVYLNRYKTLDTDGETRLIVGSTAGSKVTNATDYDVCVPTHLTICLGENDLDKFSTTTAANVVSDMTAMYNVIHTQQPSIIVGMYTNPTRGVLFSTRYPRAVTLGRDNTRNTFKANVNASIESTVGDIATQQSAKLYSIPTFYITYPPSSMDDSVAYDELGSLLISGTDKVHPGLKALQSIGNQIYAWILYTLNF